jgi:uncharacterized protein with GYD domain
LLVKIIKEEKMAKMYIMGKYTEKAYLGFLKDPTTDRKAAVEKLTSAAGGKMLSMDIVRGSYDFIVVAEVSSFETFVAIKLAVESSGAVKDLTALEAINIASAARKAGELTGNYKAPGK